MKNLLKIAFAISLCISVSYAASQKGTMTDPRDGKKYKTVKFGDQVWMAENLNYKTSSSYCYDDNPDNCKKYGRLYKWAAAQKACPNGWHLPDKHDITSFFSRLQCTSEEDPNNCGIVGLEHADLGYKLKSKRDWKNPDSRCAWHDDNDATDEFSFSILPAGYRSSTEEFDEIGESAYFWTSVGYYNEGAPAVHLSYCFDSIRLSDFNGAGYHKNGARSVRCIKD